MASEADKGSPTMFERFDETARRVLVLATEQARTRRHATVRTEHLLAALLVDAREPAGRCLTALGIDLAMIQAGLPMGENERSGHLPFSSHCRALFERANGLDEEQGESVSTLHLLTGIVSFPSCGAHRLLRGLGVDVHWLHDLRGTDGLLDVAAVEEPWRQGRLLL